MAIRSILVAVDFEGAAARAVAVGGAIAAHGPASLRLLHAESIEAPAYFTSEQIADLERQRVAITSQAEQFLTRFGRQHTSVPFVATIDRRMPADAILAAAASVDLVVMGTHGRHGPKRWWLGSVAERVLRDIRTPLLVVRTTETDRTPELADRVFDRVIVHAAAPLAGDAALTLAHELASQFGGTATDERYRPMEPARWRSDATLVAVAAPEPRTAAWTASYGEPLVRGCTLPILFVPEVRKGAWL